MLHVLWPFLWIWAMMYKPDRGWGFAHKPGEPASPKEAVAELEELRHRLAEIEAKLEIEDRAVNWQGGARLQLVHRSQRFRLLEKQTFLLQKRQLRKAEALAIATHLGARMGGH